MILSRSPLIGIVLEGNGSPFQIRLATMLVDEGEGGKAGGPINEDEALVSRPPGRVASPSYGRDQEIT